MKNYVPIDRILLDLPKSIRENNEDSDLLMWALDAYNQLDIWDRYEESVAFLEIDNHKTKIPVDAKEVHFVSYLTSKRPSKGFREASCDPKDPRNVIPLSKMQSYVRSSYYRQNFFPLKFKGNSSTICCTCPTQIPNCPQYFNIDKNRNIVTSFRQGIICLFYSRPMKDDSGNYMIIDLPEVIKYLSYSVQFQAIQERLWRHEEGSISIYDRIIDLVDTYYMKAKGTLRLRNINASLIRSIVLGVLPENTFSNYEDYQDQLKADEELETCEKVTIIEKLIPASKVPGPYISDEAALANGLEEGDEYFLAAGNEWGLPYGTTKVIGEPI
jgi:hypothetical protein